MAPFAAPHFPCVLLVDAFGISTGRVLNAPPWRPASARLVSPLRGGGEARRVQYPSPVDSRGCGRGSHPLENGQCVGIESSGSQLPGTFDGGDGPSPGSSLGLGEHPRPDDYRPPPGRTELDRRSCLPDSLRHRHSACRSHRPTLPTRYVRMAG